jgi:hypothetical protein
MRTVGSLRGDRTDLPFGRRRDLQLEQRKPCLISANASNVRSVRRAEIHVSNETPPNDLEIAQKKRAAGLGKTSDSRNSLLCPGGRTCPRGTGTPRGKSERSKVRCRIRRLDDREGNSDHPKVQLLRYPLYLRTRRFREAAQMCVACQKRTSRQRLAAPL